MKVKITRKKDGRSMKGIKSVTVTKRGSFFPHMDVEIMFGEGASINYTSKRHSVGWWNVDPNSNPGMGMDYCEKIEIFEEDS